MKRAALAIALAGCVAPPRAPPRDLVDAARALALAHASPFATEAQGEIREAEEALTAAEASARSRPGSVEAEDDGYVALRLAEKAVIMGRFAGLELALEKARGMASRLAADLARREAFFAEMDARRAALRRAQAEIHAARRAALDRARWAAVEIVEQQDGFLFRLAAAELFLPGTSLLREGGEAKLSALAAALAADPPCLVRLQILDDVDGYRTGPAVLAERRRRRVRDVLCAHGVAGDAFVPHARRPPPGAEVDVIALDPAADPAWLR